MVILKCEKKNNFLYKKIFNSRKILKFAEKNVD